MDLFDLPTPLKLLISTATLKENLFLVVLGTHYGKGAGKSLLELSLPPMAYTPALSSQWLFPSHDPHLPP